MGLHPGWGRSPVVGNDILLQHCCLENSIYRVTWWAVVHGVTKSLRRLSTHTHAHTHTYIRSVEYIFDFSCDFFSEPQTLHTPHPTLTHTHTHTHTHTSWKDTEGDQISKSFPSYPKLEVLNQVKESVNKMTFALKFHLLVKHFLKSSIESTWYACNIYLLYVGYYYSFSRL